MFANHEKTSDIIFNLYYKAVVFNNLKEEIKKKRSRFGPFKQWYMFYHIN